MRDIRIATAQFEHRDGDKSYNLGRIRSLANQAAVLGAELIAFHECCVTGYTFLQRLAREELVALSEPVPDGRSVAALQEIAASSGIAIGAGLIERTDAGSLRKCYVVVGPGGALAKHHKLHPFIHPAIEPGGQYTVFEYNGVRFGILICYDNNLPENVRITALMGAEVILMPHVTGCTPSNMPGRGTVDRALWENRQRDPVRLRQEFDGPKGRQWLLRWLPARAWENGVYAVFANNIGVDYDTIKPGLSMILDPHGEIRAECRALGDDLAVALCTAEAFESASGRRYLRARRPELYGKLIEPRPEGEPAETRPGWSLAYEEGRLASGGAHAPS
jgi:predicted amidohydrolase